MTITLIPLCVGWDSIESTVYSDESPGGYSTEPRVDSMSPPYIPNKTQIMNLTHLETEY